MLRKISIGAMLAISLALAACGTVPLPAPGPAPAPAPSPIGGQVAEIVADAKAIIQATCGWVVEGQSLANIASAMGVPYVGMAADIASQVCGALQAASAKRGSARPHVIVRGRSIAIRAHRA